MCVCGVRWGTVFIWILALACHCPEPSSPGIRPQARPFRLGSEAAAAGLCAGQCILKVNGNNVMNDGAAEVLEHFQAFRNRREEALVSPPAAKGIGEALLSGVGAKVTLLPLWESLKVAPQCFGWGRAAYLAGQSLAWALCHLCLPKPEERGCDTSLLHLSQL